MFLIEQLAGSGIDFPLFVIIGICSLSLTINNLLVLGCGIALVKRGQHEATNEDRA